MKLLFENWRGYINEEEEEANVLDLSKELDAGFCDYNPLINQYAQHSPDTLAEMLIFVVATQQMRWYDVVPKFPLLMDFVKDNDGLLIPDEASVNEKGKTIYKIPKKFAQLTLSHRKTSIQTIWERREQIFSTMSPLFAKYNASGEDSIQKEEAVFELYLELIRIPSLGLPKAAFASQLLIGRLGCIDSVNLNLYKGLDPEGKLITYNKKGHPTFKTPGKSKRGGIIQVTPGGIKLAKNYVEFLKEIAKLTQTAEGRISQKLWDSWVELISMKINKTGDINVIMPGGEKFVVPNDYSKNVKGADVNPSAAFRKKYVGSITPQDVSRQHFPKEMYEGLKRWSKFVDNVLNENVEIAPRGAHMFTRGDVGSAIPGSIAGTMQKFQKHNADAGPDDNRVVKVVMHRNGKILFLINDQGHDLPGGHLKRGEHPIAGLKREVLEETGLSIPTPEITDLMVPAGKKRFFTCPFTSDDVTLSDEHSGHEFVDISKVSTLKLRPSYKKAIYKALGRRAPGVQRITISFKRGT